MFLSWVGLLLKLTNNILSVSPEKKLLNKLFWNSNSHLRARVFAFISLVINWTKCILQRCHKVPKCSCFATNNGHFRIICLEGCKNTSIKHQNPLHTTSHPCPISSFSSPTSSFSSSVSSSVSSSSSSLSSPFDRGATHQLRSGEAKQSRIAQRWRLTLLLLSCHQGRGMKKQTVSN